VTETSSTGNAATPILARQARYLTEVARHAPSLRNTQPWRFTVSGDAIARGRAHCRASAMQ
jgi:nitroreductase